MTFLLISQQYSTVPHQFYVTICTLTPTDYIRLQCLDIDNSIDLADKNWQWPRGNWWISLLESKLHTTFAATSPLIRRERKAYHIGNINEETPSSTSSFSSSFPLIQIHCSQPLLLEGNSYWTARNSLAKEMENTKPC